jgi:NitT/TauT family transport system substrate-binding protein
MPDKIHLEFTRFSAFYSPLIATFAGGFLQQEGFQPTHGISAPGRSAIASLQEGSAQVVQSAPSQGFTPLEQGKPVPALHFAQINEMDGFFIAARKPDPAFGWDKLLKGRIVLDAGGQPLVMFKYACHKAGIDFGKLRVIQPGSGELMDKAFRDGQGDYISMQGPAPQQLEHDKVGHVVASVGKMIGPCAFSSLAATREWLATDQAKRFMRAYKKARAWLLATPAREVAEKEMPYFKGVDRAVLEKTIATYQTLGNWTPHVEITKPAYEATVDIFLHAKAITRRHRYEDVVAKPPV